MLVILINDKHVLCRRLIAVLCFKDERSKKLNDSFQTSVELSDRKPLIC